MRSILDAAGRKDVKIVGSDDMDEYKILELQRANVPYDAFGVGTAIVLSPDAPSLGAVYKLVEIDDRRGARVAVAKRAPGKASYGGAKQVYRRFGEDGSMCEDVVVRVDEKPVGEALLVPVLSPAVGVRGARAGASAGMQRLGARQRDLARDEVVDSASQYPVTPSAALKAVVALDG